MNLLKLPLKNIFCTLIHKYESSKLLDYLHCPPYRIGIELTNKCNINCIHCIKRTGYELGEMSLENFKKILPQFPNIISLSLNGVGEPLLHPQLFDVINYIKTTRPYLLTTIFSNGTLMDKITSDKLIKSGLSKIHISLDAAKPDTYKKIRGADKFENIIENIKNLMQMKRELHSKTPLAGLNFILMKENEGELVDFINLAKQLNVDYICEIDTSLFDFGDWKLKSVKPRNYFSEELKKGKSELKKLNFPCIYYPNLSESFNSFVCRKFWDEVRITFNGNVTLGCCTPFAEQYSYGNVFKEHFMDIWNNENFIKNRKLARKGIPPTSLCKECLNSIKEHLT